MKTIASLLAALALLSPLAVFANCTTHTIVNTTTGKVTTCTVCCFGTPPNVTCNTTCF